MNAIIIGLTGGIGSGKTYVAGIFRALGARLIGVDKIGHNIINYPQVKRTLLKWYGDEILGKGGKLNRRKIAGLSFGNDRNIKRLNRLTHPYIRKEIIRQLRENNNRPERTSACNNPAGTGIPVIIIDAPLLLETGLDKLCDYVIFVRASRKTRLKRILASRNWDAAEMSRREKYQMSLPEKKSKADFIINNESSNTTLGHTKRILRMITNNT